VSKLCNAVNQNSQRIATILHSFAFVITLGWLQHIYLYYVGWSSCCYAVALDHNHSLGIAEALNYSRPSRAAKQQYDEYFMGEMNVSEATRAH